MSMSDTELLTIYTQGYCRHALVIKPHHPSGFRLTGNSFRFLDVRHSYL
jgi:hypothetical protein